ncbi:MAG: c-type cytochrome, partial [Vicinamibacterales bacterium]
RGRGAAAAANSTGPGARGGPGGAPAFPRPESGAQSSAGGRGRGNATAPTRLTAEPKSLVALAAAGGATGERADALLARLTWPGKPAPANDAPPVAPLTAEEQKRFDEGKTVYTTLCMACHQENGQGQEKVAPTLVGSGFALGEPGVPARILLNGKEGPVGLMPPLGAVITDEQIAAVLTYTRRSWGNQATAVDPPMIAEIRKATADRTRPWTEEELTKLLRP